MGVAIIYHMEPVVSNSATNTCGDPISSNCVLVSQPVPGVTGVCFPANLTTVITALGTTVVGNQSITGLDLGCLYSTTIGTCPAGWTFVPANGTTPAYCTNGCPPGSVPVGTNPDGSLTCRFCPLSAPCPSPAPIYIPNPTPPPTTLLGILQLMINHIPCCDPCNASISASSSANHVPTP
jgi:hypothetical protein